MQRAASKGQFLQMGNAYQPRCKNNLMNSNTPLLRHWARFAAAFAFLLTLGSTAYAQDGAAIFQANCTQCHKINEKYVGPALRDVHKKHDEAYLLKWIRNSQGVIKAGDPYAVALYKEYSETVMPAFDLPDGDIKAVIAYIKTESEKPAPAVAGETAGAPGAPAQASSDAPLFLYIGSIILAVLAAVLILRIASGYFKLQNVRLFRWNNVNGILFLVFLLGFFWFVLYNIQSYSQYFLPEAASEHGVITDKMMWFTFGITFFVFIITHILLFGSAYLYRGKPGKRGYFYPDNKKLEFFWTLIPAIVLTGMILYGSRVWLQITSQDVPKNVNTIELFAKQFEWRAHYAGPDGQMGAHDYRLIGADEGKNAIGLDPRDPKSSDDVVIKELHLPVNRPVLFKFRAQDVIHSAYLPQFRVQMNVVPGLPTQFFWTPTITTHEMRQKLGDGTFDYEMACNKICGSTHFNMRLKVVIESDAEYAKWLAGQKPFLHRDMAQTTPAAKPVAAK